MPTEAPCVDPFPTGFPPDQDTWPPDSTPMDPENEARYQRRRDANPPLFLRTTGLKSGNPRDQLEPVGLDVLAGFLWEKALVDLRVVDTGTVERVQILAILVGRERDTVTVRQCWAREDGVRTDRLEFDAENIRWVRPTQVDLFDVEPIRKPAAAPMPDDTETRLAIVYRAILDTYEFATPFTEAQLTKPKGRRGDVALRARQEMMVLLYEMTDLDAATVCVSYFGYRSAMPLSTAYGWTHDQEYRSRVRNMAKAVDAVLERAGHRKQRRSKRTHRTWPVVL